jgi:hypothetical protein
MKEISGVLQELLMLMLTNDNRLLNTTTDVLTTNKEFVTGFLCLLGKFPTHSSTVHYLTNVLLISGEILRKDPETLSYDMNI